MFNKWFKKKAEPEPPVVEDPAKPTHILDVPVIFWPTSFGGYDSLTIRDACDGTQIFGGMGSGKSSGSGYALAKAFLDLGMGGLVMCAKPDEAQEWRRYSQEANREADLIVLDKSCRHTFNFLDYEFNRAGPRSGDTDEMLQLFNIALEMSGRGGSSVGGDTFWRDSVILWLQHAINFIAPSDEQMTMENLARIIKTAAQSPEEFHNPDWRANSYLWKVGRQSLNNLDADKYPDRTRSFNRAADYYFGEYVTMAPKMRSSIMAVFNSMADGLLDGLLYRLFCTETTFRPEVCEAGKIVVLDVPVLTYGDKGAMIQGLIKYIWQKAIQRRDVAESPLPIFHWADESQLFVNSYDADFQQTSRSARCCTVFLTQNISNYLARIGGKDARANTDRLLGGLQTKIFHLNGDKFTNEYASETIAKEEVVKLSITETVNDEGVSKGKTASTAFEYSVQPNTFLSLKNGGPRNQGVVTAIIFKAGMGWLENGRTFRPIAFKQRGF